MRRNCKRCGKEGMRERNIARKGEEGGRRRRRMEGREKAKGWEIDEEQREGMTKGENRMKK
jgi:hypothetical protein